MQDITNLKQHLIKAILLSMALISSYTAKAQADNGSIAVSVLATRIFVDTPDFVNAESFTFKYNREIVSNLTGEIGFGFTHSLSFGLEGDLLTEEITKFLKSYFKLRAGLNASLFEINKHEIKFGIGLSIRHAYEVEHNYAESIFGSNEVLTKNIYSKRFDFGTYVGIIYLIEINEKIAPGILIEADSYGVGSTLLSAGILLKVNI